MEAKSVVKCLILEDEFYTALEICRLLKEYDDRYRIIRILEHCKDFVQYLSTEELPDLIVSNVMLADDYLFRLPTISELEVPVILTCIGNSEECSSVPNLVGVIEKPVTKPILFECLQKFETKYYHLTHV